jgi:hypothetical protein
MQLPREGDFPIMTLLHDYTENTDDLLALNQCQLFLHAYHVSDLTDGSGQVITEDAWRGICFQSWPQQANPSRKDWDLWKNTLRDASFTEE